MSTGSRPRTPGWLNGRLLSGVLLVLVSVLLGARVMASADDTVSVWAVTGDVAAGTVLAESDLKATQVRLSDGTGPYVSATELVVGRTSTHELFAGELLPKSALVTAPVSMLASLPVKGGHAPPSLRRGQRVDVYATTREGTGAAVSELVLSGVPVQDIDRAGGRFTTGGDLAIVVRVPTDDAAAVVRALQAPQLDVLAVVGGSQR